MYKIIAFLNVTVKINKFLVASRVVIIRIRGMTLALKIVSIEIKKRTF